MKSFVFLTAFFCGWIFLQKTHAQEDSLKNQADSVALDSTQNQAIRLKKAQKIFLFEDSTGISKPARAALLSAAFPGLGQIYTKKLWYLRLPIIYGLGGFMAYLINNDHKRYVELRDAYLYALDNNPITNPDIKFAGFNSQSLKRNRDTYRRNRDYYFILSLGVYVLNIAEAATMAHLNEFDISDDLSFRLEPDFQVVQGVAVGGLTLKFPIGDRRKMRSQEIKLHKTAF